MILLWLFGIIVLLFGVVVFRGAPYVPSRPKDVARAFAVLCPVDDSDVVVDIGAGDGVVLREAAKYGARAVGYELNPLLVVLARFLSRHQPNVEVRLADFWYVSFPQDTTVVYTFGESRDIAKMANKVAAEARRLGRPLMFISYGFAVPDLIPLKQVGAHYLYRVEPLQRNQA